MVYVLPRSQMRYLRPTNEELSVGIPDLGHLSYREYDLNNQHSLGG